MANAYREGKGWSIRAQYKGISIYKGGFSSARKAEAYLREQQSIIDRDGKPARQGPERTSLAVALSDYARECLPYRKGARQDAQRVNNYLRAANLPVIKLTEFVPVGASLATDTASDAKQNRTRYWDVALVDEPERNIPNSLVAHRDAQAQKQLAVQQARNRLGCMKVRDIQTYHVNAFIVAMKDCGAAPASIGLERAELRRFFNYAKKVWHWDSNSVNPAVGVNMPKVENVRTRILTNPEFERICEHLATYDNIYVMPLALFMLETATRVSEPVDHARWEDIDWDRKVLHLSDAKGGARDVPLSNVALGILRELKAAIIQRSKTVTRREHREKWQAAAESGRIFQTSYEAMKKAWSVACEAAGVENANIHDIRRTSATRYALEFNGNIFVVKTITGHKTDKMAARYVQISAEMVARMMDNESLPADLAPAKVYSVAADVRPLPANVVSFAQYQRSA
ncbi:MAG: tyrosine-type recombinase/integrase [Dechloromonas sp.]|nr:tyrosine-type recombinase/integrase [Dechloromonas sp.]